MEATKSNQDEGIPVPYSKKKARTVKGMGNSWYYFGLVGQIGFAVALPIAGGAIIGSYIDQQVNSYPRYTVIFLFAGIALSMINFILTIQSILRKRS